MFQWEQWCAIGLIAGASVQGKGFARTDRWVCRQASPLLRRLLTDQESLLHAFWADRDELSHFATAIAQECGIEFFLAIHDERPLYRDRLPAICA